MAAVLVLIADLLLTPVLKTDEHRQATAFDQMLCSVFGGRIYLHIVRLTEVESKALEFLSRYCEGNTGKHCAGRVVDFFNGDTWKTVPVLQKD